MDLKSLALTFVGAVVALALVKLSFIGAIGMPLALAVSVGLLLLVFFGPERLGIRFVLLGVFLTPQNDIRPLSAHSIAWCDVFLVLGFALLVPRLLTTRAHMPTLFATGAVGVLLTTTLSSIFAIDAGTSAYWGTFFVAAIVGLPLVFGFLLPDRKLLTALVIAFVSGQVFSTLIALINGEGDSGRYQGTTFQPNFFAVGGMMAVALSPFLYQAARSQFERVLVVAAGLLCASSIYLSGSRGVLLALIAVALVYPLVERSTLSAYLLVSLTLGAVPLLGRIVSAAGEDSALGRLLGKDSSTTASNTVRKDSLADGWHRFLQNPIFGSGFEDNLSYHNILLQVPVAIGLIGLVAWLAMISSFALPLFGTGRNRRLGYVALAYLTIGMTEPLLFDRVGWVPMSIALLAAILPDSAPQDEEPLTPETTAATGATALP